MGKMHKVLEYTSSCGKKINIPLATIEGEAGSGPTALLTAAVHGAEYPGVAALMQLYREIDPKLCKGTIKIVPIANMTAFEQRTMFVCPVDNKNLNRIFPGSLNGTYTENLAFHLMELASDADYYVDLHSGDMVEALAPFSLYHSGENSELDSASRSLAKYYNLPNVASSTTEGSWSDAGTTYANISRKYGIPSVIVEAGGIGQLDEPSLNMHKDGLINIMRYMGNIEGEPEPLCTQDEFADMKWVYTSCSGFYINKISVGSEIHKGDYMGSVFSIFGDETEKIYAPDSGKVLFRTTNPSVTQRGLLAGIGIR